MPPLHWTTFAPPLTSHRVDDNQYHGITDVLDIANLALNKLFTSRARVYRASLLARLFPSGRRKLTLDSRVHGHIRMMQGGDVELRCLDIVSISRNKKLLWHAVEIRARSNTEVLFGLTGETAARLAAALHAFINAHLFDLICAESRHLFEVSARLQEITESNRQYLAHADLAQTIARVPGRAAAALAHPLLDPQCMPAG